jgi:hypothetical protein
VKGARVTKLAACACGCGRQVEQPATGRPRRYFDGPCKQRDYRRRRGSRAHVVVRLTPDVRRWLRAEVDRRRREQVRALERAERRVEREARVDNPELRAAA